MEGLVNQEGRVSMCAAGKVQIANCELRMINYKREEWNGKIAVLFCPTPIYATAVKEHVDVPLLYIMLAGGAVVKNIVFNQIFIANCRGEACFSR